MSVLCQQLEAVLPAGMVIPPPLRKLYEWIEQTGRFYDNAEGRRIGMLSSERDIGTDILFFAQNSAHLGYWFGFTDRRSGKDISGGKCAEVLDRLCVFARTGADGSMAALWLGEDYRQRIVHMGSGSGSTLVCVLAEDALDFLRLLAIGYDEICWNECFSQPPTSEEDAKRRFLKPNLAYRGWLQRTFGVTIPATAAEIVKHPSEMGDTNSPDIFHQWTAAHCL